VIFTNDPFEGRRLRVRRVPEEDIAELVAERALAEGRWVYRVEDGGDVANGYGYPAETECVLAVGSPEGIAVYWTGRAPANKITDRKAAESCLPGSGDLFDLRIKDEERKELCREMLRRKHRQAVPPLIVLAVSAQEPQSSMVHQG